MTRRQLMPTRSQQKVLERLAKGDGLFRSQSFARIGDRVPVYRFNDIHRGHPEAMILTMLGAGWVKRVHEDVLSNQGQTSEEQIVITDLGKSVI